MHRFDEMNAATKDMTTLRHLSHGVAGQTERTKESLATLIIRNMLRTDMKVFNDELLRIEEELEQVADLAGQIIDQLAISCAALAEVAKKMPPPKYLPPPGQEIPVYDEGDHIPVE